MSIKNYYESSEIVFLNLRNEIEKKKKLNNDSSNIKKYSKEQLIKEKKIIDFFNNNNTWYFTKFDTQFSKNRIEYPIIVEPNWQKFNYISSYKIDLKDLLFKSEEKINYSICNININCNVTLKGESSFWIFLRTKENFSKENAIILYNREEFSECVYITLGTFFLNLHSKLVYKPFIKQQLVFSKKKNKKNDNFYNNNKINLSIKIYDEGYDTITIETFLNDRKENNFIKGNFFQQIKDNYSLMFGGKGEKIKLYKFLCQLSYKPYYLPPEITNNHVKGCTCCNIF